VRKIIEASCKLPGKTPLGDNVGKACRVCKEAAGLGVNDNGLIRTRFCNKYFSVHFLVYCKAILSCDEMNKCSRQEQLGKVLAIRESIGDGKEISHLCDTPNCIEPSHLILESRSSNMSRQNCIGYACYQDTLFKLCEHEPPCLRVKGIKEKNVNSSFPPETLGLLLEHGKARSEHRKHFLKKVSDNRLAIKEKAVISRSRLSSSKEEKKEIRKTKLSKKRKAKRKESKQSKKQKF